jgi:hypothetical protein
MVACIVSKVSLRTAVQQSWFLMGQDNLFPDCETRAVRLRISYPKKHDIIETHASKIWISELGYD